jgi:hypothetical protein
VSLVVFAVLAGVSVTEAQTFGDWHVETKPDGATALYAVTVNDSGNAFGQFCFPNSSSCVWLITLKTACKSGDEYAVLANSDTGAVQLEVLCNDQLPSGQYRYAFTDFEKVDLLVKQSLRVGFALPLQQDQFHVVRFKIRGAGAALSAMRAAAEKQARPVTSGTRDENI